MSGPSGVMDCCSLLRLKPMLLIVFLFGSTNIVCLHGNPITGVDHDLRCVNDYLFTINCSLSIAPSENCLDSNSCYWLTFKSRYKNTFVCMLKNTNGDYFCSVNTFNPMPDDDNHYSEHFDDLDSFKISLCHNKTDGSELCEKLDDEYTPVTNIKPNAPCCLTVTHNSSQHLFTWRNTYEEVGQDSDMMDNLKYQLHYYKRGDKHNVLSHEINSDDKNYSVGNQNFVPDTKYTARVRSSPNQATYQGQWSDWSSELYWETESAVKDLPSNSFVSGLVKVLVPLFMMVTFILLFCYAPFKCRKSAFIPTPAPYFDTLYRDCQGDFKSWVVTQKNTYMLKTEETLQIDTLIECAVGEEEECQPHFHHQLMEGSTYSNITDPGCDASLLGIPYAVSTMAPLSFPGSSLQSLTLHSQGGSPTEGDSGCWLERDPPWYCNEYCTLSAFQQSSPVTAEHHGGTINKILPNRDDQSGGHHWSIS
ncbi:interleukin-21 receptor isoform X1 [Perca flavescens]|uniref:interleukin-21 receptor isoform X1 n=2 Tax=Perca flavescens TaxID=8167 RepID=UPI00106E1C63|nr:interleukin-21 receptor-like isoform X1 [Perca flavescens]